MAGKASPELIDLLTTFLIQEIGSKSLDGITYTMVLKDEKNNERYNSFMKIRKEANNCKYSEDEVFRVYMVSNGYIFDMDMSVTKKISAELAKAVLKTNGDKLNNTDLIGENPEIRRRSDMINLAKYVKKQYDEGKTEVEVALFSRNSTNKIMVTGIGPKNEMLTIRYNAYAIRHWDIETVNEKLLIPAGIYISSIQPCEILPSQTGVKFKMTISK